MLKASRRSGFFDSTYHLHFDRHRSVKSECHNCNLQKENHSKMHMGEKEKLLR